MTTHSSPPAPPPSQRFPMPNQLRPVAHYLTQYICCPQDTHTFSGLGMEREREGGLGWCLEVAYLKFSMQRCFSTYRVASSVRRCVGVVGGSGSMGNNGRRRSMAASCFQLVRCVSKCHSLSLPMDVYVCVSICVCGC